ncbi:thiamine pyrophosphokinase [Spiroplasma sabaudiense Ar-1343]|uniref:Thiamine diphosphokinase n=1 Tax=Spiroplasma sabaudiense Ar-1343 TaxID=1276257 RepID=W6AK04_9MOLU|nr:thiamine diphosphokinase [Spiroplasma sabaudiense]AHI54059.1 thiamine pyrophosphokinase [Spiroplasma sabaudiense Ar-1343]
MITKNAIIVTNENQIPLKNFKNAFFIGVERGCFDLINKNIPVDLAIADFDHVSSEELEVIKSKANKIEILNPEKDLIDGEVAILWAMKEGYSDILYLANPTIRHDMNLASLNFAFKYGVRILSDKSLILLLKKGKNIISFEKYQDYTYISFVANCPTKVNIENLKYEAKNLSLEPYSLAAISNCFVPYVDGAIESDEDICMILTK